MNSDHAVTFVAASVTPAWDNNHRKFAQGINTWDDWYLIPASRPAIAAPEVYTSYVDLPGSDGKLDLSEYLTGGPTYRNRSGSLQFYADNDHGYWADRRDQILNYLHGKVMYMALLDDPDYYYKGRFRVQKPYESDGKTHWSTVTIDYELEPYKTAFVGGAKRL